MAINYLKLARSIALRTNQFGDAATAAELEEQYTATDLESVLDGMEVPYTALRDDILAVEPVVAAMIGNSSNMTLRAYLSAQRDIDNGEDMPTEAPNGAKFIGRPDGLFNAASEMPLTMADEQTVRRLLRNSGGWAKLRHDVYAIVGGKYIYSCSPVDQNGRACCCGDTSCNCIPGQAYFKCCAYNAAAASAAYNARGNSVLPDECFVLCRALVLANIARETFFLELARQYTGLAQNAAQSIGLVYESAGDAVMSTRESRNASSINA